MKRALSYVLVIVMLVGLMPLTLNDGKAFAMTDAALMGTDPGNPTLLTVESNKLVLEDSQISGKYMFLVVSEDESLTVEINGENSITCPHHGIFCADPGQTGPAGDLIITGSGILRVELATEGAITAISPNDAAALLSDGNIIIGGGVTLELISYWDGSGSNGVRQTYGIKSRLGSVTVKDNATVIAKGLYAISSDSDAASYGVWAKNGVTVSGNASLTATSDLASTGDRSKTCVSEAIHIESGGLAVWDDATVIAESGNAVSDGRDDKAPLSAGVYVKSGQVIAEGTLKAKAGDAKRKSANPDDERTYGISYGIYAKNESAGDNAVTVENSGAIFAQAGKTDCYSCGIKADAGNIGVGENAAVTVTGGSIVDFVGPGEAECQGISAENGNFTASGNVAVSMPGTEAHVSGIFAGNIDLNPGSDVTVKTGYTEGNNGAILAQSSLSIAGNVTAEVGDATGDVVGICNLGGDVRIPSGATVNVKTGDSSGDEGKTTCLVAFQDINIQGKVNAACGNADGTTGMAVAILSGRDVSVSGEVKAEAGLGTLMSCGILASGDINILGSVTNGEGEARTILANVTNSAVAGIGLYAEGKIVSDFTATEGKKLSLVTTNIKAPEIELNDVSLVGNIKISISADNVINATTLKAVNCNMVITMGGKGTKDAAFVKASDVTFDNCSIIGIGTSLSSTKTVYGVKADKLTLSGDDCREIQIMLLNSKNVNRAVGIAAPVIDGIENAVLVAAFDGSYGSVTGIKTKQFNCTDASITLGTFEEDPAAITSSAVGIDCDAANIGGASDIQIEFIASRSGGSSIGIYASEGAVNIVNTTEVSIATGYSDADTCGIFARGEVNLTNSAIVVKGDDAGKDASAIRALSGFNAYNSDVDLTAGVAAERSAALMTSTGTDVKFISDNNNMLKVTAGTAGALSTGIRVGRDMTLSGGAIITSGECATSSAITIPDGVLAIASGLHWTTSAAVASTNGAYTWSADDTTLIVSTSAIVPPSNETSHHHNNTDNTGASGGEAGTTETVAADGSKTTVTESADGSKITVQTDANGSVTSVEAAVSEKAVADAAAKGEPVKLDTSVKAAASTEEAVPVKVELPASVTPQNPAAVEIPVDNMTEGTVAVIVYGDGTEEIIKNSVQGEDGIVVMLEGSETIKVIDNTKTFSDVTGNEWFAGNVAWAAAREIMKGIGGGIFDAGALTNRGMISQILFNLDGARATAAQEGAAAERFGDVNTTSWFAGSVGWMVANGIAQGQGADFGANNPVTREQLAVLYFNYANFRGYDTSMRGSVEKFADNGTVSPWAQEALAWAVGKGLINGTTRADGSLELDPQGSSTRAMVAAITQRFCEKLF